jgi:cytoskeletal protein RodZ
VTTILKASQEIERRNAGEPTIVTPMARERPWSRSAALVLVPVAVVAGGLALLWGLARSPDAPALDAPGSAARSARVVEETKPASAAPPKVPARTVEHGDDTAPWGKIHEDTIAVAPAIERVAAAPPPMRKVQTQPRAAAAPRSETRAVPAAPAPRAETRPPPPAADPEPEERAAPSSGTPSVDVRAIKFSSDSTKSHVTLRIGGGAPMVLKEGESVRGVEVQLILEDGVYVRHGGNIRRVGITQ